MLMTFNLIRTVEIGFLTALFYLIQFRILVDFVCGLLRYHPSNGPIGFFYEFLMFFTEPCYKPFRKILPNTDFFQTEFVFALASIYIFIILSASTFTELEKILKL